MVVCAGTGSVAASALPRGECIIPLPISLAAEAFGCSAGVLGRLVNFLGRSVGIAGVLGSLP